MTKRNKDPVRRAIERKKGKDIRKAIEGKMTERTMKTHASRFSDKSPDLRFFIEITSFYGFTPHFSMFFAQICAQNT
jgi:hypothetical protein